MGILAGIGNIYFVYQFLKKLVTPFEKTDAFKLGIIDEKGKILKRRRDLETSEEKDAYNLSDTLIWNIKKLMGKIPGGKSRLASYAAALWLIKEQQDGYKITEEELELQFFDQFEKMYITIEETNSGFDHMQQFEMFGKEKIENIEGSKKLSHGQFINIDFYIKSREFKGKFYNALMVKGIHIEDSVQRVSEESSPF